MRESHSFATPGDTGPSLSDRYVSVDPIPWMGAQVYPLYSHALGDSPTIVTLTLRTSARRRGLRSLGMGVAVDGGHILLDGRQWNGLDVWSDAMAGGIGLGVCPARPGARLTLTPVWIDDSGVPVSWSGNYGMLITREDACTVLHCSTGVGPPDFGELVVEFDTAPGRPAASPIEPGELYDSGVAMLGLGDEEQAFRLWTQAANLGHVAAAYDLGVLCFRRDELPVAEHWWRTAAAGGDLRAMAGLAAVLDRLGNSAEARVWRATAEAHT